jgi:hypothetical protein
VKVAFDTATLIVLVSPNPGIVLDRNGNPINDAKARVENLFEELSESRTQIVIPTPAFSELLTRTVNAASRYFEVIRNSKYVKFEPFDERAAIEAAEMTRKALESAMGKRGGSSDSWPKIKFDRQIVAIAKVCGVEKIYSQDGGVSTLGHSVGIPVIGIADLPLPVQRSQAVMHFDKPEREKKS